ncbi:MAG: 2'-5' RNA ligase family protein [Leptospirales bacterium]
MPEPPQGFQPGTRVFLGLYPSAKTASQIASLWKSSQTEPLSGDWMNPNDLHLTLLFGGEQSEQNLANWHESARVLQESLSPYLMRHQDRIWDIHWNTDRRLLAMTFDRTSPFWVKAGELSGTLSETLLPTKRPRPFWPHLTLARRVRLDPQTREILSERLRGLLENHPLVWNGVRLYQSILSPSRTIDRYQALSDLPFSGNGP